MPISPEDLFVPAVKRLPGRPPNDPAKRGPRPFGGDVVARIMLAINKTIPEIEEGVLKDEFWAGRNSRLALRREGVVHTPQAPFNVADLGRREVSDASRMTKNARHREERRMRVPYFMDIRGHFKRPSLADLPPLEVDDVGFPIRPWPISYRSRRTLRELDRKVRFLFLYNYTSGNVTLACQEAGIVASVFEVWKQDDPLFVEKLAQCRAEIADRAYFRLISRMGLVPIPKGSMRDVRVNDGALFAFVRKVKPELFDENGDLPGMTFDALKSRTPNADLSKPHFKRPAFPIRQP